MPSKFRNAQEDALFIHGDSYVQLNVRRCRRSSGLAPIDQATFDAWFGLGVSATDRQNNIGRQTRKLAVQYLPNHVLYKECSDIANGKTHANGEVLATLSPPYTVA